MQGYCLAHCHLKFSRFSRVTSADHSIEMLLYNSSYAMVIELGNTSIFIAYSTACRGLLDPLFPVHSGARAANCGRARPKYSEVYSNCANRQAFLQRSSL